MFYDFTNLTKTLDTYLDIGVPFYDCIVMKDGKSVYHNMNGFTDAARKIRPNGKELYNI